MKPELKKLWVEALRSGEYEQTQEQLCDSTDDGGYSYCCLGVLCEVAIKAGLPITVNFGEDEPKAYDFNGITNTADLNYQLLKEFELTSENQSTLIGMNDDENAPFTEIADWIEGNL